MIFTVKIGLNGASSPGAIESPNASKLVLMLYCTMFFPQKARPDFTPIRGKNP
jgi:hypothetical protein